MSADDASGSDDGLSGEELDALADRVIDRMEARNDIDDGSLLARASRRDVLKTAGLLGGGAVLGGGAADQMVGEAQAGSAQSGTVGTANKPVDVHVEDVLPGNGVNARVGTPSNPVSEFHTEDATFKNTVTDPKGGTVDDALLAHSKADKRLEEGTVTHSDPGTASDDTWGTRTNDDVSVTFGTAFSSTPAVATGMRDNAGSQGSYYNQSTSGVTLRENYYRSSGSGGQTQSWVAVGDD